MLGEAVEMICGAGSVGIAMSTMLLSLRHIHDDSLVLSQQPQLPSFVVDLQNCETTFIIRDSSKSQTRSKKRLLLDICL